MAKRKAVEGSDGQFLDRSNLQWYSKEESNKVTFCTSLNDIIEGNGETYEFESKFLSHKVVSKDDKDQIKNNWVLFVLTDNRYILARKWGELK